MQKVVIFNQVTRHSYKVHFRGKAHSSIVKVKQHLRYFQLCKVVKYVHYVCQPQIEHDLPTKPEKAVEGYSYAFDHLQEGVFRSVCACMYV